jgi:ketosteroid isomerase-like protein
MAARKADHPLQRYGSARALAFANPPQPTPSSGTRSDRVLMVGFARGRIKATNRTWEDHWVFATTVRNGKVTNIREYIDTQVLARASEMAASST